MSTPDAKTNNNNSVDTSGAAIVAKMSDAQVFARDPEDFTKEDLADTIERLRKIVLRQRKARADDATVAADAARFKKANAAAAKKKAKSGKAIDDIMEATI